MTSERVSAQEGSVRFEHHTLSGLAREEEVVVPNLCVEDAKVQPRGHGQDNFRRDRAGQEPESQQALPRGDKSGALLNYWPSWLIAVGLILSLIWTVTLIWLLMSLLTLF
jgi:hypothetical protein